MRLAKQAVALGACCLLGAQELPIPVARPTGPVMIRPYESATAPPPRLSNSARLQRLIRGGKLYLTVQDAIALAIENNLDLEVARYGPVSAQWSLERAQAGGPLRGVTSGNSQIGTAVSGQGVAGTQKSAGVSGGGGSGGTTSGGAAVQQIGPVTANLDPVVQNTTLFSHITWPQANTVQSQVSAVVDTQRQYNTTLQQGLITGGYAQLRFNEAYLNENAPSDILNPSVAPRLYFYLQHNLLQGFGKAVNSRNITVAQRNAVASFETFRSQLVDLVTNVLYQYWALVSANDTVRSKRQALAVAQKLYDDTDNQIRLGVLSKADIYRAQLEVGTRKQELAVAQSDVGQQENVLKNLLSRNGIVDPLLAETAIVPLDSIEVPTADDLPPFRQMVATALAKRPDVAVGKIRLANAETSALGTKSGVLPFWPAAVQFWNSGLAGASQPYQGEAPDRYFVGGFGTAAGQVLRRNFPNSQFQTYIVGNIGNHQAQADYGIDQLQMRQGEMSNRRDLNQIVVDISNQTVALRQARARYSAAADTRALQQDLLTKTQESFKIGGSTFNDVIVAQRTLVNAQAAELTAKAAYARAKVGLDQVLGQTLETNHVSVDAALAGRVDFSPRGTSVPQNPTSQGLRP